MSDEQLAFLASGLIWAVCFILSSTCHEAAHAWVAKLGGDDTAEKAGQVSLDPWPHIRSEPIGMILAPIVSFAATGMMIGWASAPFDPFWAKRHPKRAAWMALAGPLANLALVILASVIYRMLKSFELFPAQETSHEVIIQCFFSMITLNLILCIFNLIPVAPLDGGRAAVLLFPERRANWVLARTQSPGPFGMFLAWGLMCAFLNQVPIEQVSFFLMGR